MIKIAIVGIGNCASSLIQGLQYYRNFTSKEQKVPGLMHTDFGGYLVRDIVPVAAFDVSEQKVGKRLIDACHAQENNDRKFVKKLLPYDVKVEMGKLLDGLDSEYSEVIASKEPCSDVVKVLVDSGADMVVNFLPVGSQKAAEYYAECAITAGCGFINCMPVFIASDEKWGAKFYRASLPVIGDDVKSQVGATIVHRVLTTLLAQRGVRLESTYQLNFGGNADFQNMLDRKRLASKKKSKTQAVTSMMLEPLDAGQVHVSPSDHVSWLTDQKYCYININGFGFGDSPLEIEVKLKVWDSPNSAGVVIDAIRAMKIGLDRKRKGPMKVPSAFFMKSPPIQIADQIGYLDLEQFIENGE